MTSLPALIAQAEFALADVQRVVALVTAFSQASFAFAPAVFRALRDWGQTMGLSSHAGSAPLLFATAALIQACAAAAALGRPPPRTAPAEAGPRRNSWQASASTEATVRFRPHRRLQGSIHKTAPVGDARVLVVQSAG